MATTKRNAMLIEEARGKIRTTQLINRLQNHAFGRNKMTNTQVRSVEILLRKVIPDLTSVDQAVEVNINYVARIPQPKPQLIEWQAEHDNLKPVN